MERILISGRMTRLGKGLFGTKTNLIDGLTYACRVLVAELLIIELITIRLI